MKNDDLVLNCTKYIITTKVQCNEYSKQPWISWNTITAHTVHFKIMGWSHYNFQMQPAHTHTLTRSLCHLFFCTWSANVLKITSFVYATKAAYIILMTVTAFHGNWHKHTHTDTHILVLSRSSWVSSSPWKSCVVIVKETNGDTLCYDVWQCACKGNWGYRFVVCLSLGGVSSWILMSHQPHRVTTGQITHSKFFYISSK